MKRKPLYKLLYVQVIVAIVIGVLVGHFLPTDGVAMKPLGDAFIKLVRMIIGPVIFCTVVTGIASMQGLCQVTGGKTSGSVACRSPVDYQAWPDRAAALHRYQLSIRSFSWARWPAALMR
jgi:hypothetical protein